MPELSSMALTDNPFIGLPLADITALRQSALLAMQDVLKTGKSNSFPGWSITRADLAELRTILSQLRTAEDNASGTGGKQMAYARINTSRQFSGYAP
jgi:hypothetical protein